MNDIRAINFPTDVDLAAFNTEPQTKLVSVFSDFNYTRTKAYVENLTLDIKEGVEAVIGFEENRPSNMRHQSLNRRDVNAEWFRIRESVLRVLDVVKNIDVTSELALEVRASARGILRVLDKVRSVPDKNLNRDIADLKKSLSQGVSKITRHQSPAYLRTAKCDVQPFQTIPAKRSVAKVEAPETVGTLKALQLIETAEGLLSSEVDLKADNAYVYLQQNLIQLHGLCLTGEIDKKRLIEAFNPATHKVEGIEFLLHSIRCVLEDKPSPLVKRAAEKARQLSAEANESEKANKAKPVERERLDRAEGPLKSYHSCQSSSPLGKSRLMVEKNEVSASWALSVIRSCKELTDNESLAVAYRLKELSRTNVCAGSALVALLARRLSYAPLKNMVYNFLQAQFQNGSLDPSVVASMRLAEKRLELSLFKFLPAV